MKATFDSWFSRWPAGLGPLLLGALAVVGWDASGWDLTLARWYGGADGFALQHDPWLSGWLHDGARKVGWVVLLTLTVAAALPERIGSGPLKRWAVLPRTERLTLVGTIWLCLIVVVLMKGLSRTSCPWDLQAFGGTAEWVSHWAWGFKDGGPGHCFPGGHASTAFAFLPLAWWLRGPAPRAARWVLIGVVGLGFVLGWVQQVRGAHFFSHNLWTAWLCWATTWAVHRSRSHCLQ